MSLDIIRDANAGYEAPSQCPRCGEPSNVRRVNLVVRCHSCGHRWADQTTTANVTTVTREVA